MMTLKKTRIILLIVVTLSFLFVGINFSNAQTGGCVVEHGRFRNRDYGSNFPENWFVDSVQQNNAQPYIYLDLQFSNQCIGQTIGIKILEQDTLFNEGDGLGIDDQVFQDPSFVVSQNQNTFVFKAGEEECDTIFNGPNCYHYLELVINGETYDFYSTGVMGLGSAIGMYYEDIEAGYVWSLVGFVNNGNLPSYVYSQYINPNDPDFQQAQEDSIQTGGQADGDVQTGGQADGDVQTGGQTGISTDVSEQIENPLGDGSSLPAFIESLLGIIVKAGIPLVVLALVYAGFRFVVAQGNPEKLNEAKKTLLYVVVGSLILLGAWTIATILNNTLNAILSSITSIIV